MSSELFQVLRHESSRLSLQLDQLQRVRRLMQACQVRSMPVDGRQFDWQPSGLMITGSEDEGMLIVLDHPAPQQDVRVCRGCGCTDLKACMTLTGPCTWRVLYGDGTGLCSHCDDCGPQPQLFTQSASAAGTNSEAKHGR